MGSTAVTPTLLTPGGGNRVGSKAALVPRPCPVVLRAGMRGHGQTGWKEQTCLILRSWSFGASPELLTLCSGVFWASTEPHKMPNTRHTQMREAEYTPPAWSLPEPCGGKSCSALCAPSFSTSSHGIHWKTQPPFSTKTLGLEPQRTYVVYSLFLGGWWEARV